MTRTSGESFNKVLLFPKGINMDLSLVQAVFKGLIKNKPKHDTSVALV
jgi:hypothetical protein